MREIGKYGLSNITNSFFKKGTFIEIDNKQIEIDNINKYFEKECLYLSNLIEDKSDFVKLENNDREGYFFYTTKKRSEILISKFNKDNKAKYEIKKYNGSNIKIVSEELINYSNKLIILQNEIKILTKEQYLKTLNYFFNKYNNILNQITKFIAIIDINKCACLCSLKYKYFKPIIQNSNNNKSFFKAVEIRHPIIEVINEEINYVHNDLELYHSKCNGILLYGVNGSGKSSLSKAIGCNILLAQIGFYVPTKEFIYYPYKKIFTRINGEDNIFKGMSSFAVEMDELRSILKYSDDRSIVLGDEICKGTEETSALSIVSASIIRFCQKDVNFIFATHFHKLYELECIKNILNIKFMHLTISYDTEKETIIYGRKLEEGPGDNLYGIEIANYIINDELFIKDAKMIRNNILNENNEILNNKVSNYNNKLFVDKCAICGSTTFIGQLDTHHIIEQNNFEKEDFNKNKLSNLVILCKKHHDEVHNGQLYINGYLDTIEGKKLEFIYKNNRSDKKKKFNEDQIKIIKDLILKFKDHKQHLKLVIQELKKENLNISPKTLKLIYNNEY
jgi:DNA mismatch repair protein MutS